jgi:type I restriction enzyme S subunit
VKTSIEPLGEVCDINPATEYDFRPDDLCSFVPMEAVDEIDACIARVATRPFHEVAQGYTPFAENDVIVAKITPCMENGKCAIGRGLRGGVGFGSTEFHVLRATRRVIPEWLFYFWRFPRTLRLASLNMTGSAGQKRVPASFLETLGIPLPEVPEQRRIAGRLEQADRLRRTRRYALELADTFLPAAFLDLFGDPRHNPHQWPRKPLSAVCSKFSDGPFGSNLKSSHYRSSGVRVVRLQNIGVGEFLDDDRAFVSEQHFATLGKHTCLPGDVLIGTLGDPNLRACIQPSDIKVALNKADCIQARPDPKWVSPVYLRGLLNLPNTLHLVPGMVHGQTRSRISMGELADLPIPVPPLPVQREFEGLVEEVERIRAMQRELARQAEHLFAALLHDAFSA